MNILYESVHSILEHDEIKLFLELGHKVFSLNGAYQNGQGDGKRPPLTMDINPHLQDVAMQCSRENIHQEIIDWSDIIIVMHRTDWIKNNWDKMKGKKVILRTIGQNNESNERDIEPLRKKGLLIVRMSESEKTIPNYQGEDVIIRFYKDEDEFKLYNGQTSRIVNISQAMFGNDKVHSRGDHMAIDSFKKIVDGYPWRIYGSDNEYAGENYGGILTYEDLKTMLAFNRLFLYTGTQPSPYTLSFIEALMTGIPVVALGENLWNSVYINQKTYDIPSILEVGVNGYYSDSIPQLRGWIKELLNDQDRAKEIGKKGRATAISFFGKNKIKNDWNKFLNSL